MARCVIAYRKEGIDVEGRGWGFAELKFITYNFSSIPQFHPPLVTPVMGGVRAPTGGAALAVLLSPRKVLLQLLPLLLACRILPSQSTLNPLPPAGSARSPRPWATPGRTARGGEGGGLRPPSPTS